MADSAVKLGTYDIEPNMNPVSGFSDPAVQDCLKLIAENYTDKNEKDVRNQKIANMWTSNLTLHEPNGPRRITPKKMAQAVLQTQAKMKPLDFVLHGVQAQPWEERLATAGLSTVLKAGKFDATFRDKGGVAPNLLDYGDAFRLIGARSQKGFPVEFSCIPNSNLYVNTQATAMRGNDPVTKAAVVFSGSWDLFIKLFPDAKNIASIGPIPRDTNYTKQLNKTYIQRMKEYNKQMEWCYYFDIEHDVYCVFAGSDCAVIDKKVGDDYPFRMKNQHKEEQTFIPISQYSCFPARQGFYNSGLGDMLWDLVTLYQEIMNQFARNISNTVNSPSIVNLPNEEEMKFFQKLQMSYQEEALGKRAFIPISYGAAGGNQVSIQSLATPALANEAQALFNQIDVEFRRFGIYLDEAENVQTATETLSQIERANQMVQQIMESNSTEAEFELNAALSMTRDLVKDSDSTPLNLTTMIDYPNPETGEMEKLRPDFFTLGMFKKGLGDRHWFVRMNDKTGVVPSQTLKRAQLMNIAPLLPQGSAALMEVVKGIGAIDEVDIDFNDATMAAPNPQAAQGQDTATPEQISQDQVQFRELSPV